MRSKNGLVSGVKKRKEKKKGRLNLNKIAASLKSWTFYICLIRKKKGSKMDSKVFGKTENIQYRKITVL